MRAFVFTCHLLTAAAASADHGWVEVQSEHFLVRSDAGEAAATELARELERFRQVVGRLSLLPEQSVTQEAWDALDAALTMAPGLLRLTQAIAPIAQAR